MSPSLSMTVRILAFFVGTPIFYFVFYETIQSRVPLLGASLRHLVNVVFGAVFVLVWVLLWGREVKWTAARVKRTLVSLAITVLVAAGIGVLIKPLWIPWSNIIIAWSCWAILWIGATAYLWAETPAEWLERRRHETGRALRCPKCGYNMTGLQSARCPECGTQYTLDDLVDSVLGHP